MRRLPRRSKRWRPRCPPPRPALPSPRPWGIAMHTCAQAHAHVPRRISIFSIEHHQVLHRAPSGRCRTSGAYGPNIRHLYATHQSHRSSIMHNTPVMETIPATGTAQLQMCSCDRPTLMAHDHAYEHTGTDLLAAASSRRAHSLPASRTRAATLSDPAGALLAPGRGRPR